MLVLYVLQDETRRISSSAVLAPVLLSEDEDVEMGADQARHQSPEEHLQALVNMAFDMHDAVSRVSKRFCCCYCC